MRASNLEFQRYFGLLCVAAIDEYAALRWPSTSPEHHRHATLGATLRSHDWRLSAGIRVVEDGLWTGRQAHLFEVSIVPQTAVRGTRPLCWSPDEHEPRFPSPYWRDIWHNGVAAAGDRKYCIRPQPLHIRNHPDVPTDPPAVARRHPASPLDDRVHIRPGLGTIISYRKTATSPAS
jgi:hypothetical protein